MTKLRDAVNNSSRPRKIGGRAHAHRLQQVLGRAHAPLAGLVDLGRRHRFGEGQVLVLHHHAPEQRNEEDSEETADNHQRRRLGIGPGRREIRPRARHDERRDGEDRASRDRFADRPDGSRHVLLENRTLEQAQDRHADDRRRVGRRDGHAGAQPEVGVGRAEDHGHDQAEKNRP